MTKEALYELIEERKLALEEEIENGDPDFDRLKEIVESHNLYKAEDLVKLDLVELFPLILKVEDKNLYDYYMKKFDGRWEKLIKSNKKDAIYQLVSSRFDYIYAIGITYQIAASKYLEVHNGTKEELADGFFVDEDLERIFDGHENFRYAYDELKKEQDLKRVASDIEWLGKLSMFRGGYISTVDFLIVLQGYIDSYNNIMLSKESRSKEVLKEIATGKMDFSIPAVEDVLPEVIDSAVSEYVDTVADDTLVKAKKAFRIKEIIPDFMKFYNSALQKRENFLKNSKRRINKYARFKESFDAAFEQDEIIDASSLVEGLDEDIKRIALEIVYEHNQKFYTDCAAKYSVVVENESLQYQLLLRDYGIEPGTYLLSDVMKLSLEGLKEFLDKLKEINIVDAELLVDILKVGSINTIKDSYKYIKRGIISTGFLKKNIEFFNCYSSVYENALNNIAAFLEKKLSPNYVSNNQDVLLIDNGLLLSNLRVLEEYKLSTNLHPEIRSNFLREDNLGELFDVIIELGYENRLQDDLNIANFGRSRWKRVELLKQMRLPVEEDELELVLGSDTFFVPDEEIDNYIYRPLRKEMLEKTEKIEAGGLGVIIEKLEEYSATPFSYDIGGAKVSRNKVIRNLSKLENVPMTYSEKLFISILCDKSVNKNDYDDIASIFNVNGQKVLSKINHS